MDFAQAKIHSLVTVANENGEISDLDSEKDLEQMKFKEVETRFLTQFSMPAEEKLVNCKSS